MQNIGERLEEARKRKGISLREAAEATKIRSDFLSSIEQNKFDFDLPDIYKRGFLKNYARFLKLDVEKVLTDYNAQLLSQSRLGKKTGSEWFGQMEVKKPVQPETSANPMEAEEEEEKSFGPRNLFSPPKRTPHGAVDQAEPEKEDDGDRTFYLKVGLIFIGTLALVFVVFGLIWSILSSGNSDIAETPETPVLRDVPNASEALAAGNAGEVSANAITLVASGDLRVVVRQKSDRSVIFDGNLSAGDRVEVEKTGPVDVLFTAGEHLIVEAGSARFRPNTTGTAVIPIP